MKAQILDFQSQKQELTSLDYQLKKAMDFAHDGKITEMYGALDKILVTHPADWAFAYRKCQLLLEASNQTQYATESTFEGF